MTTSFPVSSAISFAIFQHRDQRRVNGAPYISHPLAVMSRVRKIGLGPEYEATAVLHDVCEECPLVNQAALTSIFNAKISSQVACLSKEPRQLFPLGTAGGNARIQNYLRKLATGFKRDPKLMFIKMCDQLDNLRSITVFPQVKRVCILTEIRDEFLPLYATFRRFLPPYLLPKFATLFTSLKETIALS